MTFRETAFNGNNTVLVAPINGDERKLGRLPARSDPRALMFSRFATEPKRLPPRTNFWPQRKAFPLRTFGNTEVGDCTRASQGDLDGIRRAVNRVSSRKIA